jgi:hypothetical protein
LLSKFANYSRIREDRERSTTWSTYYHQLTDGKRIASTYAKEAMLRIQRSSNDGIVFSLSGRIQMADVAELQRLVSLEAPGQDIALDLQDITLVDRDAVKYLARCEAENIALRSCPAYIREWIDAERGSNRLHGDERKQARIQEGDV